MPPFEGAATFVTFGMDDLMPRWPNLMREGVFNDISALLGVALAIAFLASLENTLMSKALASRSGDHADVNQDMFSVGMANLASAFAGGMPASGSLTRSALNFDSGARTRFASLFSGVFSLGACRAHRRLGGVGRAAHRLHSQSRARGAGDRPVILALQPPQHPHLPALHHG